MIDKYDKIKINGKLYCLVPQATLTYEKKTGFFISKGELAKKILSVVWQLTGGQSPVGMLTQIGNEVGLTRERVRQLANKQFIANRKLNKELKSNCYLCGNEFPLTDKRMKFCTNKCRKLYHFYKYYRLVICEECGLGFLSYTGRNQRKEHFCSKTCQGRWFARKYGWGSIAQKNKGKSPKTKVLLKKDLGKTFTFEEFTRRYGYSTNGAHSRLNNLLLHETIIETEKEVYQINERP